MIDEIIARTKQEEGWRAFVYDDHLGYKTIGWGFCIDPRKTAGLPKPVAEFWLRYEINRRIEALERRWPPFKTQPVDVRRALVEMAYQMGVDGVLGFTKMLAALEAGDRDTAANEAADSKWGKQTPARAKRVEHMIRGAP